MMVHTTLYKTYDPFVQTHRLFFSSLFKNKHRDCEITLKNFRAIERENFFPFFTHNQVLCSSSYFFVCFESHYRCFESAINSPQPGNGRGRERDGNPMREGCGKGAGIHLQFPHSRLNPSHKNGTFKYIFALAIIVATTQLH